MIGFQDYWLYHILSSDPSLDYHTQVACKSFFSLLCYPFDTMTVVCDTLQQCAKVIRYTNTYLTSFRLIVNANPL